MMRGLVTLAVLLLSVPCSAVDLVLTCGTASGSNWTNPSNILASGGGSAVCSTTDTLSVTNCGAAIPSGATILGIQVRHIGCGTSGTANARRITLNLLNLGTCTAKANLAQAQCATTTDATEGSTSDTWSCTGPITAEAINSTSFGASLVNTSSVERDMDFLSITVTYTPPDEHRQQMHLM